jgi:hypothetical protein
MIGSQTRIPDQTPLRPQPIQSAIDLFHSSLCHMLLLLAQTFITFGGPQAHAHSVEDAELAGAFAANCSSGSVARVRWLGFFEVGIRRRKDILITGDPNIKRGQEKDAQKHGRYQTPDNHDCERALGVRTDAMRECGG